MCLPAAASTGETARDYIQPHVTRMQYQQLLESINLDRDQQLIASALYSDYAAIINAAVDMADSDAASAGRDTIDAVLAGRMRLPADELRALRADVIAAYTSVWPAADAALDHLLTGTTALLTDAQRSTSEAGLRALRREVYLGPALLQQFNSDYAGDGVCIIDLAEDAQAEGGELKSVDPTALRDLLGQYELQLDQLLPELTAQMRQASVDRRIAMIQRDSRAQRQAEARLLQPWQQLYQLNRRTAMAIGEMIASIDDRQSWMNRFHRACFPWLLDDELPDRQYEWLAQQSLPEPVWTQIQQAYALYDSQRRMLAESIIELIVDARLTLGVPMHPMMDPTDVPDDATDAYEQMIRLTGEQKASRLQVRDAFNTLLTDAQRRSMNRAVR